MYYYKQLVDKYQITFMKPSVGLPTTLPNYVSKRASRVTYGKMRDAIMEWKSVNQITGQKGHWVHLTVEATN